MLYHIKKFTILLLFIGSAIFAQSQGMVDAYFCSAPFYEPGKGTYLETYLTIGEKELIYERVEDGLKQASLEVTMIFKNGDKIKEYRKYNLGSPLYEMYSRSYKPFVDVQKIYLPDGVYNFELIVRDVNAPDTVPNYKFETIIAIDILPNKMSFSGIQFLDKYKETKTKNIYERDGYYCKPYLNNVFPASESRILFYMELYWAAKEFQPLEEFVVNGHIESIGTGKPVADINYFSPDKARNKNVFTSSVNISNLPSGNYFFVVEVRTKKGKLVAKNSRYFIRENDNVKAKPDNYDVSISGTFAEAIGLDSLMYFVESRRPIGDEFEQQFIDSIAEKATAKQLRQFFYVFWKMRNTNFPEEEWNKYKYSAIDVDNQFGVMDIYGFDTEKGELYLEFGPPNSVIKEDTNDIMAKEVWHYFSILDLKDIKFVFEKSTNEPEGYRLFSSNMPGVEINN